MLPIPGDSNGDLTPNFDGGDCAPYDSFTFTGGKVKAVRFSTLEKLCRELNCQPGDLLEYKPD